MPERSIDKPFRMSISDIFKGTGSGFCVSGRIETGVLCANDKILVCPMREQAIAKGITIDDMTRTSVFAGDHVAVTLAGVDVSNIYIGCILSDVGNPIPMTQRLQIRILVFNIKVPITMGTRVILHHQSLIEPAEIRKLKAQLHKGTGEVIKKNPRCLGNNSCALVEIETTKIICIERYADCKELGRVMLRVGGVTVAAGLVTKILRWAAVFNKIEISLLLRLSFYFNELLYFYDERLVSGICFLFLKFEIWPWTVKVQNKFQVLKRWAGKLAGNPKFPTEIVS